MPNCLAKLLHVKFANVDAIEKNLAALNFVEAQQQLNDGSFAGAGVADDGGGLAGQHDGRKRRAESILLLRIFAAV